MGGRARPSESFKTADPSAEKKRGLTDWMNFIKPGNEEKDHWVRLNYKNSLWRIRKDMFLIHCLHATLTFHGATDSTNRIELYHLSSELFFNLYFFPHRSLMKLFQNVRHAVQTLELLCGGYVLLYWSCVAAFV